jgi:hypothetical protein
MYAITGAFGQTGLALSQALLDAGQSIGQRVGHRAHCGKADPFEARSRCLGKCFEKRRRIKLWLHAATYAAKQAIK